MTERIRRSRFEIFAEILKLASGEHVNITRIVYRANLNFKLAQIYLEYLVERGMIERLEIDGRIRYRTTERGREFIRKYNGMIDAL